MAMEVGRYSLSIVRENGAQVTDRGKYLKVWRRLGAWRIVADCWSSNLPASVSEEKSAGKVTLISDDVPKSA